MNTVDTPAPITWSDAFLMGYGPMDKVHQEFVELVSALQQAADEDVAACLEAFEVHARAHFDAENDWMTRTEFPARECHIDEHAAVMRSVQEVRELVAQGRHDIGRDLANELARWFPGHTDYLDSALAHWMAKRDLGGKPVVIRRNIAAVSPAPPDARDTASSAPPGMAPAPSSSSD